MSSKIECLFGHPKYELLPMPPVTELSEFYLCRICKKHGYAMDSFNHNHRTDLTFDGSHILTATECIGTRLESRRYYLYKGNRPICVKTNCANGDVYYTSSNDLRSYKKKPKKWYWEKEFNKVHGGK